MKNRPHLLILGQFIYIPNPQRVPGESPGRLRVLDGSDKIEPSHYKEIFCGWRTLVIRHPF